MRRRRALLLLHPLTRARSAWETKIALLALRAWSTLTESRLGASQEPAPQGAEEAAGKASGHAGEGIWELQYRSSFEEKNPIGLLGKLNHQAVVPADECGQPRPSQREAAHRPVTEKDVHS